MSDTTSLTPFENAIEALRERERQYDADAQALLIRRDELRETIALLTSRKPRAPRKPRTMTEATDQAPQAPAASPALPASAPPSPFRFVPTLAPDPAEAAA